MRLITQITQRVFTVAAGLLLGAVAALGLAAYLTASGHSLTLLKASAAQLGTLLDGQHTDELTVEAALFPGAHRLDARARLKVRSERERQHLFYFLLNNGLTIRRARVVDRPDAVRVYQLWMITVVDIGRPLAANEPVELELEYDGQPATGGLGIEGGRLDAREVLLNVDDFWYPSDVQGFFTADVTVTLPQRLTLVHNGRELEHSARGDRQRVRWRSERPIAGMALVAGPYRRTATTIDNLPVQVYLADDVALDADRVLRDMADANRILTERFGSSGFPQLTLFVTRRIRRGFNDGSGLMGLSIRYFRRGEYGFRTVAHEIAHNWWGGTVGEKWLTPRSGGEWIVEGLAEFSSLLATEARWGADALTRGLTEEFFDPARQAAVADMSVLDNALAEATARDTIYRKGAYVAMMLRATLGDEAMQQALRQFVERFRYTQATDRDLETIVHDASGHDVAPFFADWVRSNKLADLALEPSGPAQVEVVNRGEAIVPGPITLWVSRDHGAAPEQRTVQVGETVALPSDAAVAVLDPQLVWADMRRFNNRAPRQPAPRFVSVSSRGDRLLTAGEPHPTAPATVTHQTPDGKTAHTWEFERGLIEPPAWSIDGSRIIASTSDPSGSWPAIVSLNAVDGGRTTIGYGTSPAVAGNGYVFAARGDQVVRLDAHGSRSIARHRGRSVESPLPSPSGAHVAYVAARGSQMDLRLSDGNGTENRSLLTWDRDRFLAQWAPDESRLYAVMGGDWDWQLWEISLEPQMPVRVLAREAADIRDLAISPDGARLAFAAAPATSGPVLSHQLYVLDLKTGRGQALATAGDDVWQLAWETPDTLLVVSGSNETPVVIPEHRRIRRVRLNDGTAEEVDR